MTTPVAKRQHPTLSDVALALATRRSDPVSKVSISDANAKGTRQLTVEVADPDAKVAAEKSLNLYRVTRAALDADAPRENGATT